MRTLLIRLNASFRSLALSWFFWNLEGTEPFLSGQAPLASSVRLSLEKVWDRAVLGGLEVQAVGVATANDRLCLTLTSRHPVPQLLETVTSILAECLHLPEH
jgi:hypothetical protein